MVVDPGDLIIIILVLLYYSVYIHICGTHITVLCNLEGVLGGTMGHICRFLFGEQFGHAGREVVCVVTRGVWGRATVPWVCVYGYFWGRGPWRLVGFD